MRVQWSSSHCLFICMSCRCFLCRQRKRSDISVLFVPPVCCSQPPLFGYTLGMNGQTAGWAIPVTEWAPCDKWLHLDSGSHPPLCTLRLLGDSCQLLHLCLPCKSAEQLERPVDVDPSLPNLLLSCLPAAVRALMMVPLLAPVWATVEPFVRRLSRAHDVVIATFRLIIKQEQVWVRGSRKRKEMISPEMKSLRRL